MLKIRFKRSKYDNCVYYKFLSEHVFVVLLLYVDDILIASNNKYEVDLVKTELSKEFEMKDLGGANRILVIEIIRNRDEGLLMLSQETYLKKVLDKFGMLDAKPVSTPISQQFKLSMDQVPKSNEDLEYISQIPYVNAVGSLMYAMVCIQLDIAYVVSLVSRFMANAGKEHWKTLKWILRYLKGSLGNGLVYGGAVGH